MTDATRTQRKVAVHFFSEDLAESGILFTEQYGYIDP